MSFGIFHIADDGRLVAMNEQPYDSEDLLQSLLEKYPALLAGDQISSRSPRRWLLVRREMGVPGEEGGCDRWSADHLFIDQEAIPTFVEVKRSSDTRIRREVVGQMLDYAANAIVYWPVERIQAEFESASREGGQGADERLADFLNDEQTPEEFWLRARTNLQAGRLRLLFVADHIPEELRRIIEFLNGQMDRTEVLAVEIKQYVGERGRSLVPRVFGHTANAESAKSRGRAPKRQWDEHSLIEDVAARAGANAAEVARRLIDWSRREIGEPGWGSGPTNGSCSVGFEDHGLRHLVFIIWSSGSLGIPLKELREHSPPAHKRFVERLNEIEGIHLTGLESLRYINLDVLAPPAALERFLEAIRSMRMDLRGADATNASAA